MSNNSRPLVATLFGVTSILLGAFGLLGILGLSEIIKDWRGYSELLGQVMATLTFVNQFVGIVCAALTIWSGLLLIMNSKQALNITKIVSILSIIQASAVLLVSFFSFGSIIFSGAALLGTSITIVMGILHPILILLLVVKNPRVKEAFSA